MAKLRTARVPNIRGAQSGRTIKGTIGETIGEMIGRGGGGGNREGGICWKIGTLAVIFLNRGCVLAYSLEKYLVRSAVAAHTLGRFEGLSVEANSMQAKKMFCHKPKGTIGISLHLCSHRA